MLSGMFAPHVVAGGGGVTDPDFANVVALLHLDGTNGSTTFTDVTGKTWTAPAGGTITTANKKFGTGSLTLSPTTDYISTASHAGFGFGTGDFTMEAWVYVNNVSSRVNALFDTRTGANTGINVFVGGGAFGVPGSPLGASSNTAAMGYGGTLTANTWHHIAVARQGTTLRGFIDGVQAFSVTDSRTYASASTCFIGADYAGTTGQRYGGQIDDVRITNGVARYTAGFTPPSAAFPDS